MQIVKRPSPNFTERRGVTRPDMVVLHYTGMESAGAACERLCDPAAEVSAHYLVAEDGKIFMLVDEEMRAWHAGIARWGAVDDVNSHSIGIELANPGHQLGYPPFPEPQMAALEVLLGDVLARWSIPPQRVVGHACVSPGRKIDPGEKFDWRRLGRQGLAVWLDPDGADGSMDVELFRAAAKRFGYPVTDGTGWDEQLLNVWHSFVMRFRPGEAEIDPHGAGIKHLARLAERWPISR